MKAVIFLLATFSLLSFADDLGVTEVMPEDPIVAVEPLAEPTEKAEQPAVVAAPVVAPAQTAALVKTEPVQKTPTPSKRKPASIIPSEPAAKPVEPKVIENYPVPQSVGLPQRVNSNTVEE